jgi:hypothetical protein
LTPYGLIKMASIKASRACVRRLEPEFIEAAFFIFIPHPSSAASPEGSFPPITRMFMGSGFGDTQARGGGKKIFIYKYMSSPRSGQSSTRYASSALRRIYLYIKINKGLSINLKFRVLTSASHRCQDTKLPSAAKLGSFPYC